MVLIAEQPSRVVMSGSLNPITFVRGILTLLAIFRQLALDAGGSDGYAWRFISTLFLSRLRPMKGFFRAHDGSDNLMVGTLLFGPVLVRTSPYTTRILSEAGASIRSWAPFSSEK